jgi:hypothetical protein
VLTLGSALAAWVEPTLLGGGFVNLLSNSVESAFTALRYPVVAALTAFAIADGDAARPGFAAWERLALLPAQLKRRKYRVRIDT